MRSVLEYGCHTYFSNNHTLLSKLDRIQYQAIRLSLGYRNSTPTNVMLAESCELPLRLRFSLLSDRFTTKILSIHCHPLICILQNLQTTISHKNRHNIKNTFPLYKSFIKALKFRDKLATSSGSPVFETEFDALTFYPSIDTHRGREILTSRHPQATFERCFATNLKETTVFYTDGSKKDESSYVGCAIYSPTLELQTQHKISSYASIFTAESLALQIIIENKLQSSSIFSDSLSVLQTLEHQLTPPYHKYYLLCQV